MQQLTALRSRLARLALVAVVVLPLGISASTIPVGAAYFYQGYTDTVSGGPNAGVGFTSTVEFTIGFSSSWYPLTIDVTKYTDTMTFAKCSLACPITHQTTEGYGCNPWHESYSECGSWPWEHRSTLSCTSTATSGCSLTRIEQPRLWMPWYAASATGSVWNNPAVSVPVGPCNAIHMFNPPGLVGTTTNTAHDLDWACLST
jgi:hypothetical protein